ncbi:alpha/beta hydrolase [Microbacterium gilvum]|uniref:Alpha/beta hydrolase n=1 Tax=Microbacterium gilvum TaxID=1336204 RepID=A0ABP9AU71_9MICO
MSSRRGRRIAAWVGGVVGGLVVVVVAGILIWSQVGVMGAEAEPLASVQDDPAIVAEDTSGAIVLSPAESDSGEAGDVGLVFVPGAKVAPWAYAAKLSDLVAEEGMTVVITRPWLNLAFFDLRPLSDFTSLAPEVGTWMVGGHSLGGVRSCQLAADADALVLFGSYCANDLADSGLPVLSISGSEDGLSTPDKIADARPLLPADAELVEIAGANHASFGDYGPQAGDGTATIPDDEMTAQITELVGALAATLD